MENDLDLQQMRFGFSGQRVIARLSGMVSITQAAIKTIASLLLLSPIAQLFLIN